MTCQVACKTVAIATRWHRVSCQRVAIGKKLASGNR